MGNFSKIREIKNAKTSLDITHILQRILFQSLVIEINTFKSSLKSQFGKFLSIENKRIKYLVENERKSGKF